MGSSDLVNSYCMGIGGFVRTMAFRCCVPFGLCPILHLLRNICLLRIRYLNMYRRGVDSLCLRFYLDYVRMLNLISRILYSAEPFVISNTL